MKLTQSRVLGWVWSVLVVLVATGGMKLGREYENYRIRCWFAKVLEPLKMKSWDEIEPAEKAGEKAEEGAK